MKYVVGHEEDVLCVCRELTDAEEYILSCAEENQYEDFLFYGEIYCLYWVVRDYWIQEVEEY